MTKARGAERRLPADGMGRAESEVRTESIPKQQTCGDGQRAEDP
jgi:hypothetical protein